MFAKFEEFKRKFGEALDGMVAQIGASMGIGVAGKAKIAHGDSEYLLAMDEVVLPVARAFAPDVIIVSCGFDAARGDPLGQYDLTPQGYAHLTRRLQAIGSARGKVVVVLEGGYNLQAIGDSAAAIFRALLGEPVEPLETQAPRDDAVETVAHVLAIHRAAGLLKDAPLKDRPTREGAGAGEPGASGGKRGAEPGGRGKAAPMARMHSSRALARMGRGKGGAKVSIPKRKGPG